MLSRKQLFTIITSGLHTAAQFIAFIQAACLCVGWPAQQGKHFCAGSHCW